MPYICPMHYRDDTMPTPAQDEAAGRLVDAGWRDVVACDGVLTLHPTGADVTRYNCAVIAEDGTVAYHVYRGPGSGKRAHIAACMAEGMGYDAAYDEAYGRSH